MIIFCLGTKGRTRKELERDLEAEKTSKGVQAELEAQPKSSSSLSRSPGAVRTKTDAQVAYGLRLGRSTYARKDKKTTFPMVLVPCQNSS